MNKCSGFTVSKNCLSLDYPIGLTILSMRSVCDEVVIGDMGSIDGTFEQLKQLSSADPCVRVVKIHDWTLEKGNPEWFVRALNECRMALKYPMALELDADEVLSDDPKTLAIVRKAIEDGDCIAVDRLNFARDARSLIPEGEAVGKYVVRVGPSNLWWPSDEFHNRGEVELLDRAHIEPDAKIFHLGFLRNTEAYFAKARVVLGAFFNEFDVRLAEAEAKGAPPMSGMPWWDRLVPYDGPYPAVVKQWMFERGYNP